MSKLSATQIFAIFIAVAAHAAVLGWASQYSPRKNSAHPAEPMTVSLFAPAPPGFKNAPPVSQPPVKKPKATAPQERAVTPDDPSPSVAPPTTVPAAEAEPVGLSTAATLTLARGDADYLRNPTPSYPILSRRLSEQGRVLLRVLVHADGSAMSVEIASGSGYTRLDQAARETVRQWRFIPAMQGDKSVNSWVIVPINFSLKG